MASAGAGGGGPAPLSLATRSVGFMSNGVKKKQTQKELISLALAMNPLNTGHRWSKRLESKWQQRDTKRKSSH